jgi:hypothetical protein
MGRTVDTWGSWPIPERVCERVLAKVVMGPNGCHISTYSVASHGYAQVGWTDERGRTVTLAHRAAWTGVHGPIPLGMTVDHTCPVRNRRCVRIDHLRLLPNLENARRTDGRDWDLGRCINGHSHELWRPKTEQRTKGYCVLCRREREAAKRRKLATTSRAERTFRP